MELKLLQLVVCFFPGLAIFAYSAYALRKDLVARKWPFVEGKVLSVKTIPGDRGLSKITISYEYVVNGLRYAGHRYSFGHMTGGVVGGGEIYAKIRRDLPDRPKVKVFYNPAKPAQALLVPGATWVHLIDFSLAGIFLLLGLAIYAGT